MTSLMIEQFCPRLVLTLAHFLWQGAVIALVAWLSAAFLKGQAERFRYSIFLASLLAMPLAAALTANLVEVQPRHESDANSSGVANTTTSLNKAEVRPAEIAPVHHAPVMRTPIPIVEGVRPEGLRTLDGRLRSSGQKLDSADAEIVTTSSRELLGIPVAVPTPDEIASAEVVSSTSRPSPRPVELWLTALYSGGVLLMLLRLAFGLRGGSRLRQQASPIHEPDLLRCLALQVEKIGLRSRPTLAWCQCVAVPTVVGVFRPIVLLPAGFATGLTVRQLQALISHELIHIRRWDPAVNILQRLIEAAFFFHPAVWFVSKQIRNERENCTDDAVVRLGFPSVEYAKALLQAAELAVFGRTPEVDLIAVQAGESPSQLTRRVRRLLNSREHEIFALSRPGIFALLLVIAGSIAVAGSTGLTGRNTEQESEASARDATDDPAGAGTSNQESSKTKNEKAKSDNQARDDSGSEARSNENNDDNEVAVTVKEEIRDGVLQRSFELTRSQDKSRPHSRVVFPNGVEFTILGVTTFPHKEGDDWWLPTGEALPGKPVHFVAPEFEGDPKKERRAVLVRVDNMPPWITAKRKWPDDVGRGAKSSQERGVFLLSQTFAHVVEVEKPDVNERYRKASLKVAEEELTAAVAANRKISGTVPQAEIDRLTRQVARARQALELAQSARKQNQKSAELTFRFPGGMWETEAFFEREKLNSNKFRQVAIGLGPRGDISIEPPRRPEYGAAIDPTSQVRIQYDGTSKDGHEFSMRAVAINSVGQRILPTGHSGTPRDGESQVDFFFPMRPEEIQEVSIESIQFTNSVTFIGLATDVGQPATPHVKITAPAVSEAGEFAYAVSKRIESRVQFTDPMIGIRTQREFAELLNRYAPARPDGAFQAALMTALDRHLDRVWPNIGGMRDSFAWDDIHLFQLQRVRNLQWLLFQFFQRQTLSEQDQKNLDRQLELIRNHIHKAAAGDDKNNRDQWLAEFDSLLSDPLSPCFRRPLTVDQQVEFSESIDDLSEPFSIGRLVDAWVEAQFPSSQSGSSEPEFELSTFKEPVWRFVRDGKTSALAAEYFSAARQSGVEVLVEAISRNGAFIELQSGLAGAASGGAKLARISSDGGEQETADWFADREAGAFYLDADRNRLVGVRGTKFLPLLTRYWQETDFIPTSHIARAIEKSGLNAWQFWKDNGSANRPVSYASTLLAMQTADGRVYVASVAGRKDLTSIRVRPHDTPTPESGEIPDAVARLIVQGEISDVDGEIGRRFIRDISDRHYDSELTARVEMFVDQLRAGDGTAAEFMTPGVSPRTIRSWEWWGEAGGTEIQDEWKRLRREVSEGKFRVGNGGFVRLQFWPDFGFHVVRSDRRGYFRLIGVDAGGQQWQKVFLLERISGGFPETQSGWMITGCAQGRMSSEDFLHDSPAHSHDWNETEKFTATPSQVETGNFYLDLDSGSRFTQPEQEATVDWILGSGVDLRFGSTSMNPKSTGVDLLSATAVLPGADFSRLSPGSALHLLGRSSPRDQSITGQHLVRTRGGAVFVLQTRSHDNGGMEVRVRQLSREKLESRITIDGLENPGPNADLPTGTDWQKGKYGIEYRIRQEKAIWRLGEHPLVFVDLRSDGRTERLAVSSPQFQHYIDYDGGRYSRSVGGTFHAIPTEEFTTVTFVMSPLWQREPHKDPMPLEPGRHALRIHLRLGTLPLYDDDGNIIRPPGEQFRPDPIATVPIAIVISKDDVRRDSTVRAANILRELIALAEFNSSQELPHTLQNMIAPYLPESAEVLLTVCESTERKMAKRAAHVLVRFLDDLSDDQVKRYFRAGFAHFAEKRDHYPLGIDVLIGLGFRFEFGHEGLPKDRKYQFKTTTRNILDGLGIGDPYSYAGPGAATGHVELKDLKPGPHTIKMQTDWEFTRGERTLRDTFESDDLNFEIASTDTPDDLIAEPDPALAKVVQEAMQFRESESSFHRRSRFRLPGKEDTERAWRPNTYTVSRDGSGPVYALHTPAWRMNRLLPIDLAFRMKMKVEGTDLEFPCGDVVVPAGERTYTRHVYTRDSLDELVKTLLKHADKNGFVNVRLVLTPSREVALQNPEVKKYFPGSITSEVLRIRASTSTEVPPGLPEPDPKYRSDFDDDNG